MPRQAAISVEHAILTIRNQRVILSSDLAEIYVVEVRALNQAVKRNAGRFPPDFAFRLTLREAATARRSRSQSVILKRGQNLKYVPLAFTEHGAVMAATVLNSTRAVEMSVFVVRAFLRLRQWVAEKSQLSERLLRLEHRVGRHDRDLRKIVHAIRKLIEGPPDPEPARIGFRAAIPAERRLRG